ncbi:unnamed protein product [Cuscuta campestris]|uniref:Uncharacterized protein n=1 Tax=Cuscuta campestris TaxID=132261 RepID=A0A484K6I3_9ASTE|nr:unnamed protein product [Cuscuta campestris]
MVAGNNENKTSVKIKGNKHHNASDEDVGAHKSMSKTTKGPKPVIHLGAWNKNLSGSPKSDVSSYQREQYLPTSNGGEEMGQKNLNEHTERNEIAAAGRKDHLNQTQGQKAGGKELPLIKIKKSLELKLLIEQLSQLGKNLPTGHLWEKEAMRLAWLLQGL